MTCSAGTRSLEMSRSATLSCWLKGFFFSFLGHDGLAVELLQTHVPGVSDGFGLRGAAGPRIP